MENIVAGIELFQKGGFIMYVLLLCSLFVVAVGIERWQYFHREDSGRQFASRFMELAGKADYAGAMTLAASHSGALSRLLHEAAVRYADGHEDVAAYLEIQSGTALARFRQRLYYLSVVVTMAPLLGLLGTISGMISAFSVFNGDSAQAAAITGGVGEALIATAFGLCVAILALMIHAYFSQRLENIVTDMESCFSLMETNPSAFAEKVRKEEEGAQHALA